MVKGSDRGAFEKESTDRQQFLRETIVDNRMKIEKKMESKFEENKKDRDEKHGEMVSKVDDIGEKLAQSAVKMEQLEQLLLGRQQPTPAKLQFEVPANVIVQVDDATTTHQSSDSSTTLQSIAAAESLPPAAAKEEAVNLEDTVDVKSGVQASSQSIVDSPLANTKSTTVGLSLPAANNTKNTVEVKVEKKSMTAPHTPDPRDFTLRDTRPTSTARVKKDQRPPSGLKRRLADTPQSRTRLSEAVSEHIERRKRGRVMETANSEAKTVNMKLEKSFQIKQQSTQRVTRSASKKEPPSGSR